MAKSPDSEVLFIPSYYTASITENSAALPHLLQVHAVNGRLESISSFSYSLLSGNKGNMFSLDRYTGVLSAVAMFDREETAQYVLQVQAMQGNVSNTTTVTVIITDVDDNPSMSSGHRLFLLNNFNRSLAAGSLGKVRATDLDNNAGSLRCSQLTNDAPSVISIQSSTCEVLLLQSNPPAGTYYATVRLNDGRGRSINSTVQVHIVSLSADTVQHSFTFSIFGTPVDLLSRLRTRGIVNAIQQVMRVASSDIYLLGVTPSSIIGNVDITIAVQDQQTSSFFSRNQLLTNFTLNLGAFQQSIDGNLTRLPTDSCSSHPCQNYAECQPIMYVPSSTSRISTNEEVLYLLPLQHSYRCVCKPGTTGHHCEVALDSCYSQPCPTSSLCEVSPRAASGYICRSTLSQTIVSSSSSLLNSQPQCQCKNNGSCRAPGYCSCPELFTGQECSFSTLLSGNVNYCMSQPCQNGAQCSSNSNTFTCSCPAGFSGRHCEQAIPVLSSACDSNPCYHGGVCMAIRSISMTSYTCQCAPGYTGPQCTWSVQGCSSHPCQNNATCVDLSNDGMFICDCLPGYQGATCSQILDACHSNPCQNDGQCVQATQGYTCRCSGYFYGETCQLSILPNLCSISPCQNGANCTDGPSGYTCHCLPGFYGQKCSENATVSGSQSACSSNPCQHGSTCMDISGGGGHACLCTAGFTGKDCHVNINECQSSPCPMYATCHDAVNGYVCQCPAGFQGSRCQKTCPAGTTGLSCRAKRFFCQPGNCRNGALCLEDTTSSTGYRCACAPFYSGRNCQTLLNCSSQPCKNGGTCRSFSHGSKGYTCSCPTSFEGTNCELTSVTNQGTGYLVLPPHRLGMRDTITFSFSTWSKFGLLYHSSQLTTSAESSSILVQLFDGRLQAIVQYTADQSVQLSTSSLVADGTQHTVSLYHNAQVCDQCMALKVTRRFMLPN